MPVPGQRSDDLCIDVAISNENLANLKRELLFHSEDREISLESLRTVYN